MSIVPDLSDLIYDTGTVSINTGTTTLTGLGTAWLVSTEAPVIRAGDTFSKNGFQIPVYDVQADGTIILAAPWPGGNLVGATYQIIKGSPYRLPNFEVTIAIRHLVQALATQKPVSTGSGVPDNSLGEADQWYFRVSDTTLIPYSKVNDVWQQMALAGQWGISGSNVYYTAGHVGIGTNAPVARLDVRSAAAGIQIVVGDSIANAAAKVGRIGAAHYTNAEEPVALLVASVSSTGNSVSLGGGSGVLNAATTIDFYTAANSTTVTGTSRLNISSLGVISVLGSIASTSTTTGSLVVAGGLGVAGAINVAASSTFTSGAGSSSTGTGAIVVTGGIGVASNGQQSTFGGTVVLHRINSAFSPQLQLINGNNGSDSAYLILRKYRDGAADSGATQVNDGLGNIVYQGLDTSGTSRNALVISAAASAVDGTSVTSFMSFGVGSNATSTVLRLVSGQVQATATTSSTSTTTGALVVSGGVGIAGNVYLPVLHISGATSGLIIRRRDNNVAAYTIYSDAGALSFYNGSAITASLGATGNFALSSTTASTATTTGALTVAGGVGIGGALNIGGDFKISTSNATINLVNSSGGTNEKTWQIFSFSTSRTLQIGAVNDANNAASYGLIMVRGAGTHVIDYTQVAVGGLVVGSPTGSNKGTGNINAVGVYDDNTLLTCFGIEYLVDGKVDVAKWDGYAPKGRHQLVRSFLDMIGPDFDPRDHRSYIDKMIRDRGLPGMPTQADWEHNTLSTGEMTNRLWLSAELQASAFKSHVDETQAMAEEITQLRGRVAELEATRH